MYDAQKKAEFYYKKGISCGGEEMSCIPPRPYASRFIDFVNYSIKQDPLAKQSDSKSSSSVFEIEETKENIDHTQQL